MQQSPPTILQKGVLAFATILLLDSLWVLTAEIAKPRLPFFPSTAAAADTAAEHQAQAQFAAWIGLFRGDLWTQAAITEAAKSSFEDGADQGVSDPRADSKGDTVVQRAIAWSPHDARAWLLLAATNSRLDWVNRQATEWLKLSFYTGPNEIDLMPLRLALVTRSRASEDPEIQELERQEIRTIFTRLPGLRSAVANAYRGALPDGRKFIAAALRDLDPEFLKTLTGASPIR